jgi:hypothetical protein
MPMAAKAAPLPTFTSDNQTITATAGDTITGSYTVGGTGFNNNALQITGGATVTQAGNGNGFNARRGRFWPSASQPSWSSAADGIPNFSDFGGVNGGSTCKACSRSFPINSIL